MACQSWLWFVLHRRLSVLFLCWYVHIWMPTHVVYIQAHTHSHGLKSIALAVKPAIIWIPLLWGCARHLNLYHAVSRKKHIKSESRNKIRLFLSAVFHALVCSSTHNNNRPIMLSTAWWKNTFIGICVNVEKKVRSDFRFCRSSTGEYSSSWGQHKRCSRQRRLHTDSRKLRLHLSHSTGKDMNCRYKPRLLSFSGCKTGF